MKLNKLILAFLLVVLLTSCTKQPITPGNYTMVQPSQTTTTYTYTNGGTVLTGTNTANNNQLVGTNWVLTDVVFNYSHTIKNDTIHFVSNTKYTVGSDTTKCNYSLYSSTGSFNSTLDIYQFNPINGLYLSANNFNANAFATT